MVHYSTLPQYCTSQSAIKKYRITKGRSTILKRVIKCNVYGATVYKWSQLGPSCLPQLGSGSVPLLYKAILHRPLTQITCFHPRKTPSLQSLSQDWRLGDMYTSDFPSIFWVNMNSPHYEWHLASTSQTDYCCLLSSADKNKDWQIKKYILNFFFLFS